MTLLERLSRNRVEQEVTTEIQIEIHRTDGTRAWFKSFPDGSDLTIYRDRKRMVSPGHIHLFNEVPTAAGKSRTHIGHMVEDVHTWRCACGQTVSISYKAPN